MLRMQVRCGKPSLSPNQSRDLGIRLHLSLVEVPYHELGIMASGNDLEESVGTACTLGRGWRNEEKIKIAYLRDGERWRTCLQEWGSVMCPGKHGEQLGGRGTPDASSAFSILDPHMAVCTHTAPAPTELYLQPDLAATD